MRQNNPLSQEHFWLHFHAQFASHSAGVSPKLLWRHACCPTGGCMYANRFNFYYYSCFTRIILYIPLRWIWAVKSSRQEVLYYNPHLAAHYPWRVTWARSRRAASAVNSSNSLKWDQITALQFGKYDGSSKEKLINTSLRSQHTPARCTPLLWLIRSGNSGNEEDSSMIFTLSYYVWPLKFLQLQRL